MSRIAIASLGSPIHSDDAVSEIVCRILQESGFLNADYYYGHPFNYLGRLSEYDTVFLVDSLLSGDEPGKVKLMTLDDVSGPSLSTHSASVDLIKRMLESKNVFLIGIVVKKVGPGTRVSPELVPKEIAGEVARLIKSVLQCS